jgi:hypothetical protein
MACMFHYLLLMSGFSTYLANPKVENSASFVLLIFSPSSSRYLFLHRQRTADLGADDRSTTLDGGTKHRWKFIT